MPIGCFFGAWGSCVAAGEEVCGCGMLEREYVRPPRREGGGLTRLTDKKVFQRGADLPRECMEKSGLKV